MGIKHSNLKVILFIITFTVFLLVGLQNFHVILTFIDYVIGLLVPFIIGACIAFILNLPMSFIENKWFGRFNNKYINKLRRPISVILSLLFVIAIIAIVVVLIVPELTSTITKLITSIPEFADEVGAWVQGLAEEYPQVQKWVSEIDFNWDKMGDNLISFVNTTANGLFFSTVDVVTSFVSGALTFFIGFMFSFYLLFKKENLAKQGKQVLYAYLPERTTKRIIYIMRLTNQMFTNFISGQCTEAIILGLMFYVILVIFDFPYALLISVFIAFMSLIPIFGAFIASYASAFLILMENPLQALAFLVVFAVIQQIEESFIYPHVVGGSVGLPSIWVLAAVTLGGSMMGIIGMLIFIPLCGVLYTLVRANVKERLVKKEIPKEKWEE